MNRKYSPVRVHDTRPLIDGDRHDERGGDDVHVSCAQVISVGYASIHVSDGNEKFQSSQTSPTDTTSKSLFVLHDRGSRGLRGIGFGYFLFSDGG